MPTQLPNADDIDDGLEYDVASSASDSEQGAVVDLSEDESAASGTLAKPLVTESSSAKKRKAGGSKLQEKKRLKMEMDIEQKKQMSKESDVSVIADFINKRISQRNADLSGIELAERFFNKNEIRLTADLCGGERTLDKLPELISSKFKNMLPHSGSKNKKTSKNSGPSAEELAEDRKFIAIVSMSAIRACDIHRITKDLSGSSLKLINKNKIDIDLKLIKTTRSRVLCCTPGRLLKVLNAEDLGLKREEIKIIIVDNSYLDGKCQNIWDIKETTDVLKELTKNGSKMYLY